MVKNGLDFNQRHLSWYQHCGLISALATRKDLASRLLPTGIGIELGPLAWPTPLSNQHYVAYADFRTKEESMRFYHDKLPPKTQSPAIMDIDILWADYFLNHKTTDLDFFIANHVFEHLPDPLLFLNQVSAMLRTGARVMLTVPNAEVIYDKNRPRTTLTDFISASATNDLARAKVLEYVIHVEKIKDPREAAYRQGVLLTSHDDPHLWTFDRVTYPILLEETFEQFKLPFKIQSTIYNNAFEEIITFLEKT